MSPVGTAHAYDLVKLLSQAIAESGSVEREVVRKTLENLNRYEGLVRVYEQPFTANHHDALDSSDFSLAQFDSNGNIRPVTLE